MKGTMSELELSLFRQRSQEALKQKARLTETTALQNRDVRHRRQSGPKASRRACPFPK
jgi:hypothetical protein